MKNLLISLFFSAAISTGYSQYYNTAIGVKGSWSNLDIALADLSVKHFIKGSPSAIEANLGFGRRYGWLQAMYVRNYRFFNDVEWYWGIGGDAGYWNENYSHIENGQRYAGWWSGVDANLGMEYTFSSLPINVSVDVGPTLRTIPYVKLGVMTGFAVRFAIK